MTRHREAVGGRGARTAPERGSLPDDEAAREPPQLGAEARAELWPRREDLRRVRAAAPAFIGAFVGCLILTLPSGLVIGVVERRAAVKR